MMNRLPYSEWVTMNTLTKMALRLIGQMHPDPPKDDGSPAWIDRHALSQTMQLGADQQVVLAQGGGWPAAETFS